MIMRTISHLVRLTFRLPGLRHPTVRHLIKLYGTAPLRRLERRLRGESRDYAPIDCFPLQVQNYETFFGYYDTSPMNADGRLVLAHVAPSDIRNPGPLDKIKIGYFDLQNKNQFVELDQTAAWCWQMGARLRWFPSPKSREVTYNRVTSNGYEAVIRSVDNPTEIRTIGQPLYEIDPNGHYGVSVNFSRLAWLRPGYGYGAHPDPFRHQRRPSEDGLWFIDLKSGKSTLVTSLDELANFKGHSAGPDAWHYINHVSINPSGSRIMFFHIWVDDLNDSNRWGARIMIVNPDGSGLETVNHASNPSHYCWRNDTTYVVFMHDSETGKGEYAEFSDPGGYRGPLWDHLPNRDGHQTFSPDGKTLLTDSYPDKYLEQSLMLFGKSEGPRILGRFRPSPRYRNDMRCDLHPRWSPSGNEILFDSTHQGRRKLYVIELDGL